MFATQRTLAPVTVRQRQHRKQTLKTDVSIKARGNIIAYRRSGLVQRRALLRVGRRIAPCLLCVDACAMCHSRRYALGRGTGASLVNRYCAYAPRLPPHRQTLRNTAVPTLRTARAFCAYS